MFLGVRVSHPECFYICRYRLGRATFGCCTALQNRSIISTIAGQFVRVAWLSNVTVRVIVISVVDVVVGIRRGKHQDGNSAKFTIALYAPQHIGAADPWQVPIEQDQVGKWNVLVFFLE